MRKLKFDLDCKSLEIIYSSFIRPILEYADVIRDNFSYQEKQKLEKNTNRSSKNCSRGNKTSFNPKVI